MIALLMTIPIYVSTAIAQPLPDAGQACIDKNKKTNDIVDVMENDIINGLEQTLKLLHAISTVWETYVYFLDVLILIEYDFKITIFKAITSEEHRKWVNAPFGAGGAQMLIHYLVTCNIMEGVSEATGQINAKGLGLCGLDAKIPIGENGISIPISPMSNIYSAIGCLCLPGVLFNLRKLQTTYKVYNCCVEQACKNGVSTESCEQQFSEAQCMLVGTGALFANIIRGLMSIGTKFIHKLLWEEWIRENVPYAGTIVSLGLAPFKIQSLLAAIETIQRGFTDPTCEDLGFDKLKDDISKQQSQLNCQYVPIDLNGDGINDILEYRCGPLP